MLVVIVSVKFGCVIGVVAMSLAAMAKSDEQEQEYEALKRLERRRKFTGVNS